MLTVVLGESVCVLNMCASLITTESALLSTTTSEGLGTRYSSDGGESGISGIVKETGRRMLLRLI